MVKFIIEETDEILVAHGGLPAVGQLLSQVQLRQRLNSLSVASAISNFDVAASYIGLLCQGKSDYNHIEAFRKDPFFPVALGV